MTNISILSDEFKKKIAASYLIEGLQKCEQYTTINPINVQVINTQLRNNLLLYSRNQRYKFRFIVNSLLFSTTIVGEYHFYYY